MVLSVNIYGAIAHVIAGCEQEQLKLRVFLLALRCFSLMEDSKAVVGCRYSLPKVMAMNEVQMILNANNAFALGRRVTSEM